MSTIQFTICREKAKKEKESYQQPNDKSKAHTKKTQGMRKKESSRID
jgi:hypothetical protein